MNERITFNPNQCGGRPCIRGMRVRVKDVLDLLASRVPEAEILEDYPYLEPEDIALMPNCCRHWPGCSPPTAIRPNTFDSADRRKSERFQQQIIAHFAIICRVLPCNRFDNWVIRSAR
jgi:uncharacterized protein (DUF433 family)